MKLFNTLMAIMAITAPVSAYASSDEAWEEFRAEVRDACEAATGAPENAEVAIEVNPFGSEHYGAAVVTVTQAAGEDRMICIFDKAKKGAELTAPFMPPA